METTRRFSRTLADAFADSRAPAGDPRVMRAISRLERVDRVDTSSMPLDAFPAPRWPFEAASACSEFGHDEPPKPRLTLLQRAKRFFRAQQIKRLRP